ncbi:MAG: hypothetical protein AAFW46_16350 [Pseudomonadota bacterium]
MRMMAEQRAVAAGRVFRAALRAAAIAGAVSASPALAQSSGAPQQRSLYVEVERLKPSGARWDAIALFGLEARIEGVNLQAEAPDPVACVLALDGSGAVDCEPKSLEAEPPCLDRFACEFHELPLDAPIYGLVVFDWEPVRARSTGLFDFEGQWAEMRSQWDSFDPIAVLLVSDRRLRPKSPEWEAAQERMAFLLEALLRPATDAARSRLEPPFLNVAAAELEAGLPTVGARLRIRSFE